MIMKTSKIWYAFFIIVITVAFGASCNTEPDEYIPVVLDFDITIPDDWAYNKDGLAEPYVYIAISPTEFDDFDINEDMWIAKMNLGGDNLATFYSDAKASIEDRDNYSFISEDLDTAINGAPCIILTQGETVSFYIPNTGTVNLPLIVRRYFLTKSGYGYLVTCNSLDTTYVRFKPVFDTIMSSFTFKD